MKEKLVKTRNSIIDWMDSKKIAVIMTVIFIVSMVPLFYLAFYASPTGDDYNYAMDTRRHG